LAKFSSKTTEKKIIALFFKEPFHVKSLDIDLKLFSVNAHRNLVELIRQYVKDIKSAPTKETLIDFSNSQIENESDLKCIPEAIEVLDTLPEVQIKEANYYFEKAQNYKTGRELYDLQNQVTNAFEKHEVDFVKLREELFGKLLFMGDDKDKVRRGYIYESVEDRWKNYRKLERGERDEIVPYGIKALDSVLGGMRKGWLTLLYSRTGGGKSRFATNIAYNAAVANYGVLYISLEMDFDLLANVLDARMGGIDSHNIIFGELDKEGKKDFANALKEQVKNKLGIWISDIPMNCTMANVFEEVEIYKMSQGKVPDLVIVDYANLLLPMKQYSGRSEKFDNIMKEMHELVRYYRCAGMTMMQESRDASKEDIKASIDKKKKGASDAMGVHKIGASNYAAIHCEAVIRLKRDEKDVLNNRMWAIVDKDRYGASNKKIALFAAMDINLIGDREIYAPHKAVKE